MRVRTVAPRWGSRCAIAAGTDAARSASGDQPELTTILFVRNQLLPADFGTVRCCIVH
jgi:hypothetical protein